MQTKYWFAVEFFITFVVVLFSTYVTASAVEQRIVNGKDADITNFPYQLSLRRNSVHICGASVLNSQWAITAAHCIYGYEKLTNIFTLRGGSSSRILGGSIINILTFYRHPNYNPQSMNFDVALVRTKQNRLRGDYISPIELPKVEAPIPDDTDAIVSGWGHMSASENLLSRVLKYAIVRTYNHEECNRNFKNHGGITDAMFCAAARNTDACQGDSGGPIQINNTLVGVVSWGVGCADPYYPGVYTRLTHAGIRLWIRVITQI